MLKNIIEFIKNIKNRFRPTVSPLIDKVKDDH